MEQQYVQALIEVLRRCADADTVLAQLARVLKRKGHLSIHAAILKGAIAELERAEHSDAAMVAVASEKERERHAEAIASALATLGAGDDAVALIDPTLVGGFVATYGDSRIDRSYKKKLVELYRSITA
jgi:F0F1-type ATP synthase delta subunit